jgi:SAM-dependent methyltransferase
LTHSLFDTHCICPGCLSDLEPHSGEYRCRACCRRFEITPWGPSFFDGHAGSAESQGELEGREREARIYEQSQVQEKKASYLRYQARFIARSLALSKSDLLLDAGCGTGLVTEALAPLAGQVVAVDFSLESLGVLCGKRLENVSTLHASATNLPFRDRTFGKILCSGVIQAIPPFQRTQVFNELARCLQPDGTVVITAYNEARFLSTQKPRYGTYDSGIPYYSFSWDELKAEAERAGFSKVVVRPLGMALHLQQRRFGWRTYQALHSPLNALEEALAPHVPGNRTYPSNYWLLSAGKSEHS